MTSRSLVVLAIRSTTGVPEPPALSPPAPPPLQPPAAAAAMTASITAASRVRPFIQGMVPLLSSTVEGDARGRPRRAHRGWPHNRTVASTDPHHLRHATITR